MGRFKYLFLIFPLFLWSCHKPNPNPEHLDPIFADIEKQRKDIDTAIVNEGKVYEDLQFQSQQVKPQTGQIKYVQKRLFESASRLDKLKQKRQYLELHLESRLKFDRAAYDEAFRSEKTWPDPKEYEEYKNQQKMESASLKWDVNSRIDMAAPKKPKATTHAEHNEHEE